MLLEDAFFLQDETEKNSDRLRMPMKHLLISSG